MNNITLKTIEHIEVVFNNNNKKSFYNKPKNIVKKDNFGILIERRNHKVITDENKLYGTKESHKYY